MNEVSTLALKSVKTALICFQTDISGMSHKLSNISDGILRDCMEHIGVVKAELEEIETTINNLNKQITDLETKISQSVVCCENIISDNLKIESSISLIRSQISRTNRQISELRTELENTEDSNRCNELQTQIKNCIYQISRYELDERQLEINMKENQQKKAELQELIDLAKTQKFQKENEVYHQKNRLNKTKGKFERLESAYIKVETDIKVLVDEAKRFERESYTDTQRKANAIDKCIESIDQYLAVNLYGSDGWILDRSFKNPTQYEQNSVDIVAGDPPKSDNYFSGLPVERQENGMWEVISNCRNAYLTYVENIDCFRTQIFDHYETRVVDARCIEGIGMISDRDIENPEIFWGRSGGTYESFERIALQIPEVQRRLNNGETLSALMDDEELGSCAHLFFNTENPDHPTVYEGNGFYELSGGGRHRVMLAQRLGFSIPVRIRGRFVSTN